MRSVRGMARTLTTPHSQPDDHSLHHRAVECTLPHQSQQDAHKEEVFRSGYVSSPLSILQPPYPSSLHHAPHLSPPHIPPPSPPLLFLRFTSLPPCPHLPPLLHNNAISLFLSHQNTRRSLSPTPSISNTEHQPLPSTNQRPNLLPKYQPQTTNISCCQHPSNPPYDNPPVPSTQRPEVSARCLQNKVQFFAIETGP